MKMANKSKDEFVNEQFRYLIKTATAITDDARRLHFVLSHISTMEDCMEEGEPKNKLIKSIASWAIKHFKSDKFKSDVRMLTFWKLLGKYSQEMKMEGVLENLHRLGLFNTAPEFYLMWAEHLAVHGHRENFEKIVRLCEKNCALNSLHNSQLFRSLEQKFFEIDTSKDGNTMALIKMIAARPEMVRPELTLFRKSPADAGPATSNQQTERPPESDEAVTSREQFSIFRDEPTNANRQQQQPSTLQLIQSQLSPDPYDITISGSHGKFASNKFTSTPRRSVSPKKMKALLEVSQELEVEHGELDAWLSPTKNVENPPPEDQGWKELFNGMATAGGSRLQRRLSLAPDQVSSSTDQQQSIKPTDQISEALERMKQSSKNCANKVIKAMPNLKIGSTIEEEEAIEDGKENNGLRVPVSSSCSPPDRKKRKMSEDGPPSFVSTAAGNENNSQQQNCPPNHPPMATAEGNEDNIGFDPNESTHTVHEQIKPGTVNPWDEKKRSRVLTAAPAMVECHYFGHSKCPRIDVNQIVELGGEHFCVEKFLGQGGFARVHKAISQDNNRTYAIKYEAPPCPWEVYICVTLKRRVSSQFLDYLMNVRDAYIFGNASAIVYDFYPCGTLLDLSNQYKKNGAEMGGLLATFFGIQLGRILEQVHKANIIHGDVKPDNVVLTVASFNERESFEKLLGIPVLKLIDWGRSIDMDQFPSGQEFIGRAGTENFDCIEMISGMPWTFQTDFYGFIASIYVLMKAEYLMVFKYGTTYRPKSVLKRRMALYDMWLQLFDNLLNIPDCKRLPSWTYINSQMESRLRDEVTGDLALEWRKSLERFNVYMKQRE